MLESNNTSKLIVSLTSYPARINGVASVLKSILKQTRRADKIIIYLAEEQFPLKAGDLPSELREIVNQNGIVISWCADLKSHKKYFYAMQEFPHDIIVTVDDDVLYAETVLEDLYNSYLKYPKAVSAMRTHLMAITEDNEILPYKMWPQEVDFCVGIPSMQLFATGVGGVLYPPSLFDQKMFDACAIQENCLLADDLWLKAMQVLNGIPVVLAQKYEKLEYVIGSQKEALYKHNVNENQNDNQLAKIINWIDGNYGKNFFINKLTGENEGLNLCGSVFLCRGFLDERMHYKERLENVQNRLEITYKEKSEINAKLQQSYTEKSEISAKLKQTYAEKSEINARLKQSYAEKSEINAKLKKTFAEKSEINAKLKQCYAEKSEINAKLKRTFAEKSELNLQLRDICREKEKVEEEKYQCQERIKVLTEEIYVEKEKNKKIEETILFRCYAFICRHLTIK